MQTYRISYDVEALHPGEPNVHYDVLVTLPFYEVCDLLGTLSFFEYPKGEGFVRVQNLAITRV